MGTKVSFITTLIAGACKRIQELESSMNDENFPADEELKGEFTKMRNGEIKAIQKYVMMLAGQMFEEDELEDEGLALDEAEDIAFSEDTEPTDTSMFDDSDLNSVKRRRKGILRGGRK